MGLIREPKNVDFYVIDKTWTEEEQKEFSAFIKQRKEHRKKRSSRKAITKQQKATHENSVITKTL
jgi:hypothetical protein